MNYLFIVLNVLLTFNAPFREKSSFVLFDVFIDFPSFSLVLHKVAGNACQKHQMSLPDFSRQITKNGGPRVRQYLYGFGLGSRRLSAVPSRSRPHQEAWSKHQSSPPSHVSSRGQGPGSRSRARAMWRAGACNVYCLRSSPHPVVYHVYIISYHQGNVRGQVEGLDGM